MKNNFNKKYKCMKNTSLLLRAVAYAVLPAALFSCSVDNAYDLSKDVDMTVAVGDGLTLPLGSTEKIMLTEMIDPEESDVIRVDENGFYSLYKEGTIDASTFEVRNVDINVEPMSDFRYYNFNVDTLQYENLDELPEEIQNAILSMKYPLVMSETVDANTVKYTIDQDVPDEMKRLSRMTFTKPVKLTVDLDVYAKESSKATFNLFQSLHLNTSGADESEHFYVEMPPYLKFVEGTPMGSGNKLYLEGTVEHSDSKGHKHYVNTFEIEALDFSYMENGGIEIEDGHLFISDELLANGVMTSDTVILEARDLVEIPGVCVEPTVRMETITIDSVYGIFEPIIDPIRENVKLDLGEDMDFIYDAYLDFTNPKMYVTIQNDAPIAVTGDVVINGYNKYNQHIDGSTVQTTLAILPERDNKYYISRDGAQLDDYTSVQIANLNNLLKTVPDNVSFNIDARVDNSRGFSHVKLGKKMSVKGSYELDIPLAFDSFSLEYTETVEDVLGDDPTEVTDYVTDINSVTISLVVDNTVPATFTPTIVAKAYDGTVLNNVTATVKGTINPGHGYVNNELTAPIESSIEIKLSTTEGQLADLNTLDIVLKGEGSGVFNANEYIQIKKMTVTIDEPITVDLN